MTKKVFGQVVSTQTGTADGDGRYFFQGETGCDAEYRFVGTSSLLVDGEPLPDSAPETVFGCLTSDFTFLTGDEYDGAISYPNHIILAGYVRDQLGAPVPGINVTLTRTKYDLNVATTTVVTTDVNGRYLFDTYARCSVTISANYTGTPNETYAYDGAGNRTSSHKSATYGYQPFNRLVSTSTATYLYNNNGRCSSNFKIRYARHLKHSAFCYAAVRDTSRSNCIYRGVIIGDWARQRKLLCYREDANVKSVNALQWANDEWWRHPVPVN